MKHKTCIQWCAVLGAGLLVSLSAYAGNISLLDEKQNVKIPFNVNIPDALAVDVEQTWWHQHYVNGLGLAPFSTGIKAVPALENQRSSGPLLGNFGGKGKLVRDSKEIAEKMYYPLADVIPARTDGGEYLSGHKYLPLIFVRIQDSINSKPFDAQPGNILWTDDREAGTESTMIDAAMLLDMYFGGMGIGDNLFGFSSDNMFHLLIGAELERFDSSSRTAAEIDTRRYSALMEFSPGALLGLSNEFAKDEKGRAPRQTMTLGWTFEDDVVQDVQRHSLQLRYAPLFNLLSKKLDMFVGARSYFKNKLGQWPDFYSEEEIDKKLADEKAAKVATAGMSSATVQADKANAAVGTGEQPFNSYFYMRPKVGLEYGSVTASSVLDGQIPDLALNYLIETGFSFYKESFQVGYRLNGVSGIGDKGSHMVHEFFAQVTPHGWPGRVFCTYKKGEVAPSYVDVDILQVGFGVKF